MARHEKNPSGPGTGTTQMQGTSQNESGAEAAQREGEHLSGRARGKAGELAGDLKRQAEESAEDMRQRARSAADQQKEAAIGGIQGVAHALRSASDDLRQRGQPLAAEYSRQVADGLESLAHWVSRRNVDDVTGGLEDFARQRPVAFLGGAMVAGFALARFMKSSSARRSRMSEREYRGATASAHGQQRRTEYGGASTAAPGSARQSMSTPSSASAGTPGGATAGRPPKEASDAAHG